MMLPVLKALSDGKPHSVTNVSDAVAGAMGVSEMDRQKELPMTPKRIREFLDALNQADAKKGVLITTSSFTKDAKAPLGKTDKKISLIDGQMLAELMMDHDLGIAPGKTFQLKKVDSDFFED